MSLIILDTGSGNGNGNEWDYQKKLLEAIASIDSRRHQIIFKWQLEKHPKGDNKPLDIRIFKEAYQLAHKMGYEATASIYDAESYRDLLELATIRTDKRPFGVPFVKIACQSEYNPDVYQMIPLMPRGLPLLISCDPRKEGMTGYNCHFLVCIPKYPANLEDYPPGHSGYSDHVIGLQLWNYYHPAEWEKHTVYERDASNPDAGLFALTPDQLKEVIG